MLCASCRNYRCHCWLLLWCAARGACHAAVVDVVRDSASEWGVAVTVVRAAADMRAAADVRAVAECTATAVVRADAAERGAVRCWRASCASRDCAAHCRLRRGAPSAVGRAPAAHATVSRFQRPLFWLLCRARPAHCTPTLSCCVRCGGSPLAAHGRTRRAPHVRNERDGRRLR